MRAGVTGRVLDRLLVPLVLLAVVLGGIVLAQLRAPDGTRVPDGRVEPLGDSVLVAHRARVLVPGLALTVGVAAPVTSLAAEGSDTDEELLLAPDGGRLIAVRVEPRLLVAGVEGRPEMAVRLVADGVRTEVWTSEPSLQSALAPTTVAVGTGEAVDVDDLTVEVDFGGQVQTVDVATGEIDAGVAEALYAPRTKRLGCVEVESACDFGPALPDQDPRPSFQVATGGDLTLSPWDDEHGWAPEGTLWAAIDLQVLRGLPTSRTGRTFLPLESQYTVVTLDGEPALYNDLTPTASAAGGRVVFSVPADADPALLTLTQEVRLVGTDETMPTRAEIPLVD